MRLKSPLEWSDLIHRHTLRRCFAHVNYLGVTLMPSEFRDVELSLSLLVGLTQESSLRRRVVLSPCRQWAILSLFRRTAVNYEVKVCLKKKDNHNGNVDNLPLNVFKRLHSRMPWWFASMWLFMQINFTLQQRQEPANCWANRTEWPRGGGSITQQERNKEDQGIKSGRGMKHSQCEHAGSEGIWNWPGVRSSFPLRRGGKICLPRIEIEKPAKLGGVTRLPPSSSSLGASGIICKKAQSLLSVMCLV